MQKKLLAGLLSIALLFANINTSGLQVFASETELTTDEENDIDDYTELDETEKNLEYLSDSENEESETLEEVSETKETIEENTDVKESDSSSIEEGTDVKDIETEIENDASEEILTEETSVEESTKETLVDESTEQDVEEEIITEETLTEENIIEPLAEEANITINRTYLCAGREIELENNQRYYIKWYVDDQFVSEDNYTPTKDDYECWIKAVAYDDNDEAVCTDSVYFSKLPVVYIDTEDGQAVTDKSTYKDASMFIQNNEQVNSAVYDNSIQIKGRGNSTWDLPKKPYKIKLKNKTDFYGMGKNKHWVLIANYLDESLMRNTIAYNLSKKLGLINMDTVWVDVIINGDYAGNYQLCEHIRIGDERIDIADWESEAEDIAAAIYKVEKSNGMSKEVSSEIEDQMKEDLSWVSSGRVEYSGTEYDISTYVSNWNKDITGGYIFEMSIEYDEVSKFQTDHGLRVMVNSPEYLYTNTEMMDYIQEYWQAFENAYCSVDGYTNYNGKMLHYSQLADFDSMIGYWLTMEIMGNNDAVWKSRYAYKDRGGKMFFGPVWDFDWGCGSSDVGEQADGWKVTLGINDQNFYADFVDDPYFIQKASEKYWSIRSYLESLISDGGILDDDYAYLYESGMANSAKWFYTRGFETDYNMFKEYMQKRIDWLDTQFETEESIIKSLGKYTSSDKFQITQMNTNVDTLSEHIAAQGILTDDELVLNVDLFSEDISELRIFINGLKHESIKLDETDKNSIEIIIPANALTETSGYKNVITIYLVGIDGEYLGSNFTTVIKSDSEEYEGILCEGTPYICTDDNTLSYSIDVPHIIINQIYGADNDGYCSHSFIELYNPTNEDVSLNGWALYYQSAPGGKYNGQWEKLELHGTINAYSSYLIRAKQVTNNANVLYQVPKGDVEWNDLRMYNKGGTVLLSYRHDNIAGSANIYDNNKKMPLIKGYVDMLSISGSDTDTEANIAKESAPYSEGTASPLQSKKKAIRRIAFADTDNNSAENGDCEIIDYTFGASKYIEWAAPRNLAYGEWHASDVPKYTVTLYMNDGTVSYEMIENTYTEKVIGLIVPEREGRTFKGWYTDPECVTEYNFDETPVSDIVLYAGWDINQYTVTFVTDGDKEYDKQTVEYGNTAAKPVIPSKLGYYFTGWYDGDALYDFELSITKDLTLHAGWDIELQRMSIEGLRDNNLSQSVNTINKYKIHLQPENVPYSAIAIETNGSSGIKAELEDDVLTINTVNAAEGDSLSLKFYNAVISTDTERIYIDGGKIIINAVNPTQFMNSMPEVFVKGTDDVSITFCVSLPQEIENFAIGKLYYKLEAVPYADAADKIPEEIRSATSCSIYVETIGETQQIELIVNDAEYGKGQEWKYDVKVSLILVMDEALSGDSDIADKILYTSKESFLTDIETRKNKIENSDISFDLKEHNTIVYTGQSDLAVAQVLWNEAHVINELGELRDVTAMGRGTSGGRLKVFETDGKIMVSAPKGTEPGVHTIEAVSYGPDKIYKVRKTMTVVVLKGIESLKVSVPSTRIYKQNGKQIQINATFNYNDGGEEPKLKKVIWQITDIDGNPLGSDSPLYGMVKVNNGKIVVDKRLALANESEKNCFKIMVKADDYNENEVYALSDTIEISDTKISIGSIVLLKYNPENETYENIDVSRQLTADMIENAVVVSLAAGSPNNSSYTPDELQLYQVPYSAVQYKLSNSKMSIAIEEGRAVLHVGRVTGKVTLTATTADGGKQKASMKMNLMYAKPTELAVAIQDRNGHSLGNTDSRDVSFAGTTNTVIRLHVNAKVSTESGWEPLWAYTNYTLKVNGGKILESDSLKGLYDIIVTGEKAIITLNDKANKVKKTYTLSNDYYSKLSAPKVKQVGTLAAGSLKNRSITFKLSGKYDYTGKSVIIETDMMQKTSKNKKANYYTNFDRASVQLGECSTVSSDGNITLNFDSTFIYASSYKLKITFGVVDENGVFIADAKPVSQTLKVKAAKAVKGSFKLTTSYKMKTEAGEAVLLTGKGKEIKAYNIRSLTNVTNKGTENKFTDYFQISGNQLCLKANLNESDIAYLKSKDGKKNLTGYVTYTAYHGDNGYGEPNITAKTVKITVVLK